MIARNTPSVESMFLRDVPTNFLMALRNGVFRAYEEATSRIESMQLARPEKVNVIPWIRRAMLEGELRRCGLLSGASCDVETECTGYWNHVVVMFGSVRLTQTTHRGVERPLRPANYRMAYAAQTSQRLFEFPDDADEKLTPLARIYAVLLHHAPMDASAPDYMSIRFPSADLASYYPGIIDLMQMFPQDTPRETVVIESIGDEAIPRLRSAPSPENKS